EGMGDVGLAALAELPLVLLAGDAVRVLDDGEITAWVVGADGADQVVEVVDARRAREDARHQPAQAGTLRCDLPIRHLRSCPEPILRGRGCTPRPPHQASAAARSRSFRTFLSC